MVVMEGQLLLCQTCEEELQFLRVVELDYQLLTQNLPAAQINILATTNDATGTEPSGAIRGVTDDALPAYTSGANTNMKDGAIAGAANLSFSNEPPFLALNYIIALQGVFPSRN